MCPGVRKTNIYGKWVKESLENLQIVFKLLQSSFPVYFTGHSLFLYMVSTVSISLCILVLAKVLLRDRLRSTSGHCWPTSGEQRMLQSTNRQTTMCQCQHIPAMKPIHTVMPTPVLIAWIPFDAFNKLWALQTTSQKEGITSICNQVSRVCM